MAGKSVNWVEGQFIHPHHFQQSFLELGETAASVLSDYVPFSYGITKLAISEADCENANLLVTEIECRFPSGTRFSYPGNGLVESRDFTKQLDEHKGYLEVFLGLPQLSEEEPNCLRFDELALGGHKYRYVSQMARVNDLASGGNPREIEVKLLKPKILFTGESMYGYEVLPIAAVVRSAQFGAVPKLDRNYVPPCINVDAATMLAHYKREIGARLIAKNRALRSYWNSKEVASAMKARDGFKVQALAVATNIFTQFATINRLHPFALYLKIAEIVGMLSLYCPDDTYASIPPYDHDRLGKCFEVAHGNLVKLLSMLEEVTYTSRVFSPQGELLVCPLELSWLGDNHDLYLCFEAKLPESEVNPKVQVLKVASEQVIPVLNTRRIRGMNLGEPVHHLPRLPTSPNHHYYKIPKDPTFFPKLKENPVLAIWGDFGFADLATLYLLDRA